MSDDHTLQPLAVLLETSSQLVIQAELVEVEDLNLQAEAVLLWGLDAMEEVNGVSRLEGELGEAVSSKGLQRIGSQSSGDQFMEDGRGTSGDEAFLMDLVRHNAVIDGKSSVEGLAAEQDEGARVKIEKPKLLARDVGLYLREGVLVEVRVGECEGIRGI